MFNKNMEWVVLVKHYYRNHYYRWSR